MDRPTKALKPLLDSLDTLRQQHRAGIYPTYGQIEDLFEFAAEVRAALNAGHFAGAAAAPTVSDASARCLTFELLTGAKVIVEGASLVPH